MTPAITSCKSLKLQENKNKINIPNECKCKKSQQNISKPNSTKKELNLVICNNMDLECIMLNEMSEKDKRNMISLKWDLKIQI